jgi:phosphate transport system substrate-binding protein
MKRLSRLLVLALTAAFFDGPIAHATDITGAGSTFVYPIIAKWADAYKKETGVAVNYQSIGSGGGIKQIESKTVDFGATDMPLKTEDLAKDGLVQFPIINGADVPIVHLGDIEAGQLKLTGPVLADIYLGKIKKWNDPAITSLNKDLKLPDQAITVVHRSDGSGTTFIFTNYLSKVSDEWKTKIGEGTAVNWAAGVGGKGNEGVASYVKQIDGSIGYTEFAYALQNNLAHAQLKNQAGNFVQPNTESFKAAVSGADWAKAQDFYLILTNAPGKTSWPIAGSTFILMRKSQEKPEQGAEALKFFKWAFEKGDKMALELNYVPLPETVAKLIKKSWKDNLKSASGAPIVTSM